MTSQLDALRIARLALARIIASGAPDAIEDGHTACSIIDRVLRDDGPWRAAAWLDAKLAEYRREDRRL